MSNKKKQVEEENVIEHLNENLTAASQKLVEKRKVLFWVLGIIVLCGLFVCSWLWFFHSPRVKKGFDEYTKAQNAPNDTVKAESLLKVAEQYGSYDAGKLAALEAAETLYGQKKYQEALNSLKNFKSDNPQLQAAGQMLAGDCQVNLKKYDEALKEYDHAISSSKKNPALAPIIILKKANVYREQKNGAQEIACYEQILSEYPDYTPNGPSVEAKLAEAKARYGK